MGPRPTAYREMTKKPAMHAAQRKQKTLPPHEDRLLSGLLGPQPHGIFRYDDEAHPEMPKKPLPLVDLNMRTAAWI